MKKILFLFICLPLIGAAQLKDIHPGISLGDMRKLYPAMTPDLVGTTSNIYGDDTLAGLTGKGTWIIMRDTLRSYQFASADVLGPCENFANADSAAHHLLMKKANLLLKEYTDLFGKPTLTAAPKNSVGSVYLFYTEWKTELTDVVLSVARPSYGGVEDLPNAPNGPHPKAGYGCYYKLSVQVSGSGDKIGYKFGVGQTQTEFKKKHEKLATQLVDFPDKWTMRDTLDTDYGTWRFSFVNGKLAAFTLDVYDGTIYKNPDSKAYALLLDRCKTLTKEMKKPYGKPDDLVSPSDDKYKAHSMQIYYSEIDYQARWNNVDGKSLVIRLGETGGGKQGAPVFHLEVIFPAAT